MDKNRERASRRTSNRTAAKRDGIPEGARPIVEVTRRWISGGVALCIVLVMSACAGGSIQDGAPGSRVATTAEDGAEIWRTTCYRCHNRRPATEFTSEEWAVLVDHMRTRANLTRVEADAVTAFLQELAGPS